MNANEYFQEVLINQQKAIIDQLVEGIRARDAAMTEMVETAARLRTTLEDTFATNALNTERLIFEVTALRKERDAARALLNKYGIDE